MECAICLCNIEQSATGSCSHHFCYDCLMDWCKANTTCPKCRFEIREVRLDPEYDELLHGGAPSERAASTKHPTIRLRLDPEHRAGITLTNPQSGPGVLVAYLKPSGRAYHCGLRVADVIVSINGLPATSHEQSIRIIEEATQCSRDVVCTLLSRDPPPSGEAEAMSIRQLGRVSHRDQEGVTYYAMTVLDGTSAVHVVELRYSRWRELWLEARLRFPGVCARLRFPPKGMHAFSAPSEAFKQRRGAALESFVRALLALPLPPEWVRDALDIEDDEMADDDEAEAAEATEAEALDPQPSSAAERSTDVDRVGASVAEDSESD